MSFHKNKKEEQIMSTSQKQPAKLASIEQVLDMQYQISLGLRKMPEAKASYLLKDKNAMQKFVQNLYKELEIPTQSEQALIAIPLLIEYYTKVYGIDISEIAEMEFPEHTSFQTFMAVSPQMDEDRIMLSLREYFKMNIYRYKEPIAANINRDEEAKIQKRPSGLYVFAHGGGDEPDADHRNKSYNDAVAAKMTFANAKEYLLMTGFHKFTKGYFMDKKGWTRTSSLWLVGHLVCGSWRDVSSLLYMSRGLRDVRDADYGPRELFLNL